MNEKQLKTSLMISIAVVIFLGIYSVYITFMNQDDIDTQNDIVSVINKI